MPDLYEEEQLRRNLNLMDFNRLPAEAMTDLIAQSSEQSKSMKESAQRYRKSTEKVIVLMNSKNLLHKISFSDVDLSSYADVFTDAVDGSMQQYPKPDGGWMCFYSVSRIRYPEGYNSNVDIRVTPKIQSIDQINEKGAGSEAEEFMMNMETEALKFAVLSRKKENSGILFLDGPIIDPPFKTEKSYVERRAFAIKEAFSKNIQIMGIVKQISGTLFSNHYKAFFENKDSVEFENLLSDKNLAVHVLTEYLKSDTENIVYTEPILLSEAISKGSKAGEDGKKAANVYVGQGIDVLTFMMANGYVSNPIRVDIAIPAGKKFDKDKLVLDTIKYTVRWSAPGRHIPIPVILAHEKCNIGQGAAEILFTEFITGSKGNDDTENIIQLKMMGDVH